MRRVLSPDEVSSIAAGFGEIIGHVTISETIRIGSEGYEILIEVPHENYVKSPIRVGDFIGIVTLTGYVVLGRVIEVRRSHAAGISGRTPVFNVPMDYTGLETPATVLIEPLTECPLEEFRAGTCDPSPVYSPIDPLSIAFKPMGSAITRLLALPSDGVIIGKLYSGGRVVEDVDVKVPLHTLYEHVLIVGTTGSGKTTLLKNLALALVNGIRDSTVMALDLQGDYLHLVLPPDRDVEPRVFNPLGEITVITPVTRAYLKEYGNRIREFADEYVGDEVRDRSVTLMDVDEPSLFGEAVAYALLREFVERGYGGNAKIKDVGPEIDIDEGNIRIKGVSAMISIDNASFRLNLIPWALSFVSVYRELPRLFPVFSYRVGMVFDRVISLAMDLVNRRDLDCGERLSRRSTDEKCTGVLRQEAGQRTRQQTIVSDEQGTRQQVQQLDFDKMMSNTDCVELAAVCMRMASSQRENIIRGLNMIAGVGIMDVKWPQNHRFRAVFDEPTKYEDVPKGFVSVDLRLFRENPFAASVIVYRILDGVFSVRDLELKRGLEPKPTFILIDEAHNYFPQGGTDEEGRDTVEAMINRLTRLGRVRRIGVIFATHTPDDLNNLVLQLTNTKIALRSEESILERVGLKEYTNEITYAQDGVAIVKSYALRTHTIIMRALPPQVRHRSHK